MRMACFTMCDCHCGMVDPEFDQVLVNETKFSVRLRDICGSNIFWYIDRQFGDHDQFVGMGRTGSGLYFLWHKDDYCDQHQRFHMRALYVGKGDFRQRLKRHWQGKDTSSEMIVYYSFVTLPNRAAKYVEQLLLDIYAFPLNVAENRGTKRLCAHFEQGDVD